MEPGPDELFLELRRVLPTARPVVYEAFSDADRLRRWWGPHGFTVPALDFDPRPGTRYRIAMRPPGGDPFHLGGEFADVEPPVRLAFTFAWDPPDADDVETMVTLSFAALGASSEVALRQGPFRTEARLALHRDGWTDSLDRLERLLSEPGR